MSLSKITICLTQAAFKNNYIIVPLSQYPDFFPKDSIGGGNEKEEGKLLSIYLEGLEQEIQTDIDGNKKFFRKRSWTGFFRHHKLNEGKEIVIEKISDYKYKIYPKEQDIAEYLKADDAELEENDQAQNEAIYFPTTADNRQIAMQQIRIRRGQSTFRQALRKRYGDQCMITGCQLLDIVEAAHISPYRGDRDNHPENGLLLRADLHTLFDLDLLGIDPISLAVSFHPNALSVGYDKWQGNKLICSTAKPSQTVLKSRWERFLSRLS